MAFIRDSTSAMVNVMAATKNGIESRLMAGRAVMKFRYFLTAAIIVTAVPAAQAQDANVEGRVTKLEKEMKAVQRKVFPDGAGKFFEPEIQAEAAKPAVSGSPSSSAVTDLIARVDALETQLATLTGQVETQGAAMKVMDARLKLLESTKPQEVAAGPAVPAVESETKVAVAPTKTETAPKASTPAKTNPPANPTPARTSAVAAIERPATGDAFEDSYSYGYRLWEGKFYPEAQVQLQDTVTKFPRHKRASFARNLLGRAWLDDGKPATAVKIFYDNYKNDPKGERAPESLYFLGDALAQLGKAPEACEAFGQLASAYPAEASGRLATRLAEGRKKAKCK
ncbi:MAG TPA: tetratricopeptide repeat protein [Sphingorhabdus sp.]|nr:tetratricopeptide repeat protein [Sphingorhabdus sp.]